MIKVNRLKPLSTTPTSPPIRILGKSVHERTDRRAAAPVAKPAGECPGVAGALAREEAEILMEATARSVLEDGGSHADVVEALRLAGFSAATCVSPPSIYTVSHTHVRVGHGNSIYAIDHEFGDQFALSFGSAEYERTIATVPDIVVAKLDVLVGAVGQLTRLMIREFEAREMSIPPWRLPSAMLSRWMPVGPTRSRTPHPS